MTLEGSYHSARMDDCIDPFGHTKVCFTLDAYFGYRQMGVRKEGRPKTAVVTHFRTYQYIRMPSALQKHLHPISVTRCRRYKVQTASLLILSWKHHHSLKSNRWTPWSCQQHPYILHSLEAARTRLNNKQCRFFSNKVEHLEHIIRPEKLENDHTHTTSLKEGLPPMKDS